MSSPSKAKKRRSISGDPLPMAIRPSQGLTLSRESWDRARCVSTQLQTKYDALLAQVEPEVEPDQMQPDIDPKAKLELATLGIKLADQEMEVIRLERIVAIEEKKEGLMMEKDADQRMKALNRRYISAGDDLWRHEKKRVRLDSPETLSALDPRSPDFADCMLALYQQTDGQGKKRKRDKSWREGVLDYYNCRHPEWPEKKFARCQITGMWFRADHTVAAHIVPFFVDLDAISTSLFGSKTESLQRAGNSLLLEKQIEKWFDAYHLVVLPVNAIEMPIKRWKTEIISRSIDKEYYDISQPPASSLHEKELTFDNDKRPVARFVYFHFVMAIIRAKDLNLNGWQDTWAKYYELPPFPTPGPFMRKSMLLTLATHHQTTDLAVVNSWIKGNGFDEPLRLSTREATEIARRVHVAVEEKAAGTKKLKSADKEDSEGENDEDSVDEVEED